MLKKSGINFCWTFMFMKIPKRKGGGGGHSMEVWVEVCHRGFQTLTLFIFTAILPKQLYKAHTPCIHYLLREKKRCTLVATICVYGLALLPCSRLRSMAPFGWLNFSLPSLSHPTLSRVLVSHPEEAARFPHSWYRKLWPSDSNRLLLLINLPNAMLEPKCR